MATARKKMKDAPKITGIGAATATAQREKIGRTTISISREVASRARDAAYHERETVVAIAERAILAEVERLERAHGEGFIFPPRRTS